MRKEKTLNLFFIIIVLAILWRFSENILFPKYVRWSDYKSKISFEHLSVKDGLSQSSVFSISSDKYGFLWFGTENGLNRYDGYAIKVYKKNRNNKNTISSNQIHCLYTDSKSNLWIGTLEGGLNLYNYKKDNFLRFHYDDDDENTISGNDINVIYEDNGGNLWVGTDGYGLNLVQKKREQYFFIRYLPHSEEEEGSTGAEIYDIQEDKDGYLWIATFDRGLIKAKYDGKNLIIIKSYYIFESNKDLGKNKFTHIAIRDNGSLWVGTPVGLYMFNSKDEKFIKFENKNLPNKSIFYVRNIYKDKTGVFWIGTDGQGLIKIVDNILPDKKIGIRQFQHIETFYRSLSSSAVESVFEDNSGVLWVGTYLGGVNKLIFYDASGTNREKSPFIQYETVPFDYNSLSNNFTNSFREDKNGVLWIGTDGGGLNRVIPPKNHEEMLKFDRIESFPSKVVTTIYNDSDNNIWIGTYTKGLFKIVKGTEYSQKPQFVNYKFDPKKNDSISSNFIMSLYEDRRGALWIGTIDGGLCKFNKKTKTFKRFMFDENNKRSISDNSVFVIYEDSRNNFWVGTSEGLNLFNMKSGKFRRFLYDMSRNSLNDNFITTIIENKNGSLWIGTLGGLNKINKTPNNFNDSIEFERFDQSNGFPNLSVQGMIENTTGEIWISTPNGLFEFNHRNNKYKQIGLSNGLFITEFRRESFYKTNKGDILLGSSNGFVIFDPTKISQNKTPPPVVVVDLKIFNKSVKPEEKIGGKIITNNTILEQKILKLPYQKYILTFEFLALHYVNPAKNSYAYKMIGLEKEFNYVGNRRFATYSFLPYGTYTFKVIASNSNGVWNMEGITKTIIIVPPFYMTKTFYFLLIFLIFFLIYLIYRYKVRSLTKRKEVLESLVQERTDELEIVNKKLIKLATHDELTGLTNFREFEAYYTLECQRLRRANEYISIIMIDIDCFKKYNDYYGHLAGNETLKKVAKTIKGLVKRPIDLVARYGGEEFVIVLSGTNHNGAIFVANRIRKGVENLKIKHKKSSVSRFVTISLGVASRILKQDRSYYSQELIEEADKALYKSKRDGRNRVTVS